MNEPTTDAERLAALLDGRLDERKRAEALERLASSDEAFEAYADAVAVTRELEGADADGVTPLRPAVRKRGWQSPPGRWLAVAAMIAAAALAPWVWLQGRGGNVDDPGRFVEALSRPDAGLPPGWSGRPWGVTRGAADAAGDHARAARLGARLVDLELAVRTRDERVSEISAEVVALLEGVPGASVVAEDYRGIQRRAGEPAERLLPVLEEGWKAVAGMVDQEFLELGAWAEAGRLATARRDRRFFRDPAAREALDRAAGLRSLEAPARTSIERIRSSLGGEGAPDWSTLEREFTALLRSLGS